MRFSVEESPLRGKALCILQNGMVASYQKGNLIVATAEGSVVKKMRLPFPAWKYVFGQFRILERLLHMEIRWAVEIEKDVLFFQCEDAFYEWNCKTDQWTQVKIPVRGKPLFIARVAGVDGFPDGWMMGDYGPNPKREPVRIFRRCDHASEWNTCYTFPADTVRHIHNIVPDVPRACVYILTGDEDHESGIWCVKSDFAEVAPLVLGSQKYRACQMLFPYYLTDSPSEENYIYQLRDGEEHPLHFIPGTCIYGMRCGNGLLFSTTCEPDAHIPNRVAYWLTSHPGKGIKGQFVTVSHLSQSGKLTKIAEFEHDGLPLHLFQYGTATFTNCHGRVCYFSTGCVKYADEHIFKVTWMEEALDETKKAGNVGWVSAESKAL